MNNKTKLLISLGLPQLAGAVGSIFTSSSVETWYATIIRPELNPPSWVFGPVWFTLFLLMGWSLYLVWVKPGISVSQRSRAWHIFGSQLGLNVLWSVAFFGLQSPGAALAVIAMLWVMIAINIKVFSRIDSLAGKLLWPYLAWVSFAGYLNYSIWILN